jgi:large subunit ribosomal protein L23
VLLRPIVTEKATNTGTYLFQVAKSATKSEVTKAFKARFGKVPRKVNVLNVMGKTKFRGRTVGKRADWKKAIVYLNSGETVDTAK